MNPIKDNALSYIVLFGLLALLIFVALDIFAPPAGRAEAGAAEPELTASFVPQNNLEKELEMSLGETLDVNLRHGGSIHIRGWDEERALIRVSATATVGGGRNLIKIRTINGDVHIRMSD